MWYFGTNLDWCKPAKVMFYFFDQEDHGALVQKNYQTKVWHIGTYTKSFSFLVQWVLEILISKVIQPKWGGNQLIVVHWKFFEKTPESCNVDMFCNILRNIWWCLKGPYFLRQIVPPMKATSECMATLTRLTSGLTGLPVLNYSSGMKIGQTIYYIFILIFLINIIYIGV